MGHGGNEENMADFCFQITSHLQCSLLHTLRVNCLADGEVFFSPPHMVHLRGEG